MRAGARLPGANGSKDCHDVRGDSSEYQLGPWDHPAASSNSSLTAIPKDRKVGANGAASAHQTSYKKLVTACGSLFGLVQAEQAHKSQVNKFAPISDKLKFFEGVPQSFKTIGLHFFFKFRFVRLSAGGQATCQKPDAARNRYKRVV
jgi:hypothetical protein